MYTIFRNEQEWASDRIKKRNRKKHFPSFALCFVKNNNIGWINKSKACWLALLRSKVQFFFVLAKIICCCTMISTLEGFVRKVVVMQLWGIYDIMIHCGFWFAGKLHSLLTLGITRGEELEMTENWVCWLLSRWHWTEWRSLVGAFKLIWLLD